MLDTRKKKKHEYPAIWLNLLQILCEFYGWTIDMLNVLICMDHSSAHIVYCDLWTFQLFMFHILQDFMDLHLLSPEKWHFKSIADVLK